MEDIDKNHILILDFGSQYTQLIARRMRELHIYCEVWNWNSDAEKIRKFSPNGIILSGGPESATEDSSPQVSQYVFESGVPVLGICYGMQTMVLQLGGRIEVSDTHEFGYKQVEIKIDSVLINGIEDSKTIDGKPLLDVWMSHNDKIISIPPNFNAIASTDSCPFAIIANEKKKFYGVQFHPEVTHTRQGIRILERFIRRICQCKAIRTADKIVDNIINRILKQVRKDRVILGLSGGVDSCVTAILLHRAIGKNLTCVFVNNGLLRLNETQKSIDVLCHNFNLNVIHVSAEERFFKALKGKIDPEEKRKIIGRLFLEIFNEEALKVKNVKWLAQGTIHPDVIESVESATGKFLVIKSHHNVGGFPKNIKINLIEPIKNLFKDEVRKIGLELGLPYDIVYCHPFPGPGFSIRILGEVKKEHCDLLRHADSIFIEELRKVDLYDKVSQAFAIFLPVRSVGTMGDNRKYSWVIALRAVETVDFMTANWADLPYNFLRRVSNRIINEVHGISRVTYDISSKPPATIEWE